MAGFAAMPAALLKHTHLALYGEGMARRADASNEGRRSPKN